MSTRSSQNSRVLLLLCVSVCASALGGCRSSERSSTDRETGERATGERETTDRAQPAEVNAGPGAESGTEPESPTPLALGLRRLNPPARSGAMGVHLAVAPASSESGTAGSESLLAVWLEPVSGDGDKKRARLQFARYRPGAASWSPPITIVESLTILRNWADFPAIAAGSDGQLLAHFADITDPVNFAYDVALVHSRDSGATWRRQGPAHRDDTYAEHGFVSLLATPAGVRGFWLDGRERGQPKSAPGESSEPQAGPPPPMTLRTGLLAGPSADATRAASGQLDELLDPRVCDCCGTDAAMTDAGPVVVYRDRSADELRDISIVRGTGAGWSQPTPVHRDGWVIAGCPVNGPRVTARGADVAVAWYTYADSLPQVLVAFSRDSGASFSAPVVVDRPDGARAPIGRVDIALAGAESLAEAGPGLEVVVSWLASEREEAVIVARRVASDGRLGRSVQLATARASRAAGFPRLARMADTLYLAWVETSAARDETAGKPATSIAVGALALTSIPALRSQPEPAAAQGDGTRRSLLGVGARAPEYRARSLDGRPVTLAATGVGPTLLNIWATWCEPCRTELPELIALHKKYSERGLRIIGASVDRMRTAQEIATFAKRRKIPFEIWHDRDDRARSQLAVNILPASLLIGADGTILWLKSGALKADDEALGAVIEGTLPAPTSE